MITMQLSSDYKTENWSRNRHIEIVRNAKAFIQQVHEQGISRRLSQLIDTLETSNKLIDDLQRVINEHSIFTATDNNDDHLNITTEEYHVVMDLLQDIQSQAIQKAAYPFIQTQPRLKSL